MADETTTTATPPAEPTTSAPPTTTTAPDGKSGTDAVPTKTFTQDEVNSFIAGERRKWADSEETKQLRAKAKRLDELEAAQKSAEERLTAERDEHKTKAETYSTKYRTALIRAAFTTAALGKGIPADRVDAAYRLADLAGVEVDEDADTVKGVDKAVEGLPAWLAASDKRAVPDINAGGQSTTQPDPAAREADIRRRFRLTG